MGLHWICFGILNWVGLVQVLIEWNAGGAEKSQTQVEIIKKSSCFDCRKSISNFESKSKVLSQTLNQRWKILNCSVSKVKELVRRGIPNHLRGIAWQVNHHHHHDGIDDDDDEFGKGENCDHIRCWVGRGTVSLVVNNIRNILRQPVPVKRPFIETLLGENNDDDETSACEKAIHRYITRFCLLLHLISSSLSRTLTYDLFWKSSTQPVPPPPYHHHQIHQNHNFCYNHHHHQNISWAPVLCWKRRGRPRSTLQCHESLQRPW